MEYFLYNLTGIDPDIYFAVNTTAGVLLFLTVVLPAFILCLFCVVAVLFAPELERKIKFLITNLIASEISNWVMYSVIFLGFPSRFRRQIINDVSCKIFMNILVIAGLSKYLGTALYSVMVYIYLKYGIEFVEWSVVIIAAVLSWIVAIFFGLLSFTDTYLYNNAGFCEDDSNSAYYTLIAIIALLALCFIAVFAILIFRYLRRNTFEDACMVKKYVGKHLLCIVVSSIVTFTINTLPAAYFPLRAALEDQPIVSIVLIHYFFRGIYALLWLLVPIATVAVLKPVRLTMKAMLCGKCPTYSHREEDPPADVDASAVGAEEEEHKV